MTQTNREMGIKRAAADSARQYLDLALPYYFSDVARRRGENLRRGDYVRIKGLQKHRKFQLVDIILSMDGFVSERLAAPNRTGSSWGCPGII
jgi:hypothetical protein